MTLAPSSRPSVSARLHRTVEVIEAVVEVVGVVEEVGTVATATQAVAMVVSPASRFTSSFVLLAAALTFFFTGLYSVEVLFLGCPTYLLLCYSFGSITSSEEFCLILHTQSGFWEWCVFPMGTLIGGLEAAHFGNFSYAIPKYCWRALVFVSSQPVRNVPFLGVATLRLTQTKKKEP